METLISLQTVIYIYHPAEEEQHIKHTPKVPKHVNSWVYPKYIRTYEGNWYEIH